MNKNTHAAPSSCDFDPKSITVAQARKAIDQTIRPITDSDFVALGDALNRVCSTDVVSQSNVPNHTNSAMDGYAYSADCLGAQDTRFELVGIACAGVPFTGAVSTGQCVRIMTGAVMPAGTDTVVMQERVKVDGGQITIPAGEKAKSNIRYAGEDIRVGDLVIPAGTRLGASHLGLLASLGMPKVAVVRRPKIAFFSNGDELRSVGTPLQPGEVYDSNRYTLFAMLGALNVEQTDLGVVRDDRDAIAETIRNAAQQADLVIATAGASVGDADYVKEVLAELGEVNFWKVAIKPGRPLSFGQVADAVFFGLPGNPVSVMVTFQVFLDEAIRKLSGEIPAMSVRFGLRTETPLKKRPGRMEYQRGIMMENAEGETIVRSTGEQGSGILSSMCEANCFIVLPDESTGAEAGEWVTVQPFTQH